LASPRSKLSFPLKVSVSLSLRLSAATLVAGAAGEPLDHLARQSGRRAVPALGQQVDVEPVAGGHRVHRHPGRERDANGPPVGVAPGGADIIAGALAHAVDIQVDRPVKADDHDVVGDANLGLDVVSERKDQPGKAVFDGRADRALDRLGCGRSREKQRGPDESLEQEQSGDDARATRRGPQPRRPKASLLECHPTGHAAVPRRPHGPATSARQANRARLMSGYRSH
jgi:hypothetical protein